MNSLKDIFKILVLVALSTSFLSCKTKENAEQRVSNLQTLKLNHAKYFAFSEVDDSFIIEVSNPWQGANDITFRYCIGKEEVFEENIHFIKTPATRVVCLSTTHIAFIDGLDITHTLVGVSGAKYITNPSVRKRLESKEIVDVGYEQSLNYELIVSLKPDIVFGYGVGAEAATLVEKLKSFGIPIVLVADYLEDTPLGKAEWLKFFGLFFNLYPKADSIFREIEAEYQLVQGRVMGFKSSGPKVFINLPWKEIWYVPGTNSYMATFISDAGGKYVFDNLTGNQSHPLSIEYALSKGIEADIWINVGGANTLNEVKNEFTRITILPAFQKGEVYNNNRQNSIVGNDFWESGAVNPHLILKDLASIFFPDSIKYSLTYYKKLR